MLAKPTLHLVSGAPTRGLVESLQREDVEVCVHGSLDAYFGQRRHPVPSCLVIDLGTSPDAGHDRRLARRGMPPVVFLAARKGDVPLAVELMRLGAADYLEERDEPERIVEALRGHLDRDRVRLERDVAVVEVRRGLERLTGRESEVLDLVVAGKTSKAIALELGLSKKTIDLHRSHIMHKLEADSVVELVRLVLLEEATR